MINVFILLDKLFSLLLVIGRGYGEFFFKIRLIFFMRLSINLKYKDYEYINNYFMVKF